MRSIIDIPVALVMCFFLALVPSANAQTSEKVKDGGYSQFGFGPAIYFVRYNEEVVSDSKDVRVRSDGTIDFSGSAYSTPLGLEVHYAFSIPGSVYSYGKNDDGTWASSKGWVASPFVGIYDVDSGIDGLATGLMLGFWRGDSKFENRSSLNIGLGYTIHRNRIVLAEGLSEGDVSPEGLDSIDLTTRKDVGGFVLLVSASVGF